MQGLLGTTLILLAACSLAAMATAAFRVPALLGYLSVGVVLGPSVIGVIAPGETLSFLSELGVALLLFMVGLEFSLGDFWLARRTVLMAGALQMIAVAPPLILLLMWLGQPGQSAALLGTAAAMSSTALVSRQLADQGELTTRHGRSAIAVLVFQDLASVPLLALLAIWARGESPKIEHVLLEVFGVLLLFAAAALVSRRLLHGLLGWVARRGHEESFVLVSLCVVVAAAAAAHAVGVSAALGAFLAGMVLGESDFRHHMESHLRPFRDVLSGVFFVTIGLQLDAAQILSAPLAVLAWLVVLVPVKILLNTLALRATRLSALDAWRTGIALGHGGEFALLLLGTVLQQHLIPATVVQPMLVALVLSMALAPLLIRHHDVLARFLSRTGGVIQPPQAEEQHRWLNRLQTGLLVLTLVGIAAAAGRLPFGEGCLWLALFAVAGALLLDPVAASALSLRLYRVRALHPQQAHEMWALLRELPATPVPHYVPSAVVNAFATGSKQEASIALTDGLLRSLSPRELAGVLAHEVAHITNEDLRIMGLADSVSRLTCLLALMGQIAILLSLPALLVGAAEVYWPGLLLLAASPQLALLAQLGLSRVREFDADRLAAELTGDPQGLASALAKIERVSRSWRAWLWPGWGNPEPSCLRTRPATQERIARLLTLALGPASALPLRAPHFLPESALATRPPRWRPSGLWR
ncbi:Zn-dependent protease with chaperone function [Enterobacter asburiae]|nr:Zn-dependent protease with chaperone function [Enterobacter asburiae]SAG19347.1 Zn-dependent protease with chaperone function [Enterobacter asburiae]